MTIINGTTTLFGIIGDPVAHTASPAMHNAAFTKLGLNYVYVPLHVPSAKLEAAVLSLRVLNFRGINVTVPHKEDVIPFLDELDPLARAIGAVNTVITIDKRLVGYNTDAPGFLYALKQELGFIVTGKKVAIIGAGGTARALAVALAHGGAAKLGIVNRTMANAQHVAACVGRRCAVQSFALNTPDMRTFLSQSDLVINTTSVGMVAGETPLDDYGWVREGQYVCDVIYTPEKTEFLSQADVRGAKILNGVGMLAAQGMLAFELFTGQPIPYSFMKDQIIRRGKL